MLPQVVVFLLVCQVFIPFLIPVITKDFQAVDDNRSYSALSGSKHVTSIHSNNNNMTATKPISTTTLSSSASTTATKRKRSIPTTKSFPSLANASYHSPDFKRPAFSQIVKDHRQNLIIGDLQFLLDFAIIGHVKCGTSTMMKWLGQHPQVLCREHEIPHLTLGKIGLFAKNCYHLDETGDPTKFRAYKNPADIQNLRAIRLLREYFPQTRLLIGIRHPISWFQSFYNYRIQNTGSMPNPNTLHSCRQDSQGVCMKRADYHLSLVRLGKTNYTQEQDAFSLASEWNNLVKDDPVHSPNPVFLYDTEQLADQDQERMAQFRQDLQEFLGLSEPLPPVLHYSPGKILNETLQQERDAKKIDICSDQFVELRQILLEKAKRSAYYIGKYFIHAPDVMVSSPDYFVQILDSYTQDPCQTKKGEKS
jgi:hypothetical protein